MRWTDLVESADDMGGSMKTLSSGPVRVGSVRLPGRGPRNPPNQWLEGISNMAQFRSLWLPCTRNFYSSA